MLPSNDKCIIAISNIIFLNCYRKNIFDTSDKPNFLNCIRSSKDMDKSSTTVKVYFFPLMPVTPVGGWGQS